MESSQHVYNDLVVQHTVVQHTNDNSPPPHTVQTNRHTSIVLRYQQNVHVAYVWGPYDSVPSLHAYRLIRTVAAILWNNHFII